MLILRAKIGLFSLPTKKMAKKFGCFGEIPYICTQKVNVEDKTMESDPYYKISFRAPEKRVWACTLCIHRFKLLLRLTMFFIVQRIPLISGEESSQA